MPSLDDHKAMIRAVAVAMGPELRDEVAFVGGCTTALLLTDLYTKQQVRHTDDVDLIVHVLSYTHWTELLECLRVKGFREDMTQDGHISSMFLGRCAWISCRMRNQFSTLVTPGIEMHFYVLSCTMSATV
jgi:hypothetical protein